MNLKISPWLNSAEETPIEMSSRIRLARNIEGMTFPLHNQDVAQLLSLIHI